MKTAISIPDPVFAAAEQLAKRLGKSRSQLYAEAVAQYVEKRSDAAVTERINAVLAAEPGADRLDPVIEALQLEVLQRERW